MYPNSRLFQVCSLSLIIQCIKCSSRAHEGVTYMFLRLLVRISACHMSAAVMCSGVCVCQHPHWAVLIFRCLS